MKKLVDDKIKKIIKESLVLNETSLNAQEKKFNINTDFLSGDNLSVNNIPSI